MTNIKRRRRVRVAIIAGEAYPVYFTAKPSPSSLTTVLITREFADRLDKAEAEYNACQKILGELHK